MIIDDVRFELKDGREAILRSPKEEDAESREGVMQIELEFVEGNTRARHLYEKMGFRITGVHPNAIRLKDGMLLNNYTMIKELWR